MSATSSALYSGRVRHTRLRPFHHDFEYRVYYALFDIDELGQLDADLRLFSMGHFNFFSLNISDHGPADGSSLRTWAEDLVAKAGVQLDGGPIKLLAFPRLLGYAFNPLSEWYCYGPSGDLRAVIHEVRNTFGDRHAYVVSIGSQGLRHSFEKQMHVSPFNDLNQTYTFTINEPDNRLLLGIEQNDEDGIMFRAGMRLTRQTLSDRNLLRLFISHPLLTLKVIGGIHWEALRIWLKGGTYHPHPEPAAVKYTVIEEVSLAS
jgi:hypothetical protein